MRSQTARAVAYAMYLAHENKVAYGDVAAALAAVSFVSARASLTSANLGSPFESSGPNEPALTRPNEG